MQSQTESTSDTVSHFRLLERLGRGGMGVVYKAVDLRLERTVALKFLADPGSEEARRRFQREARAASALDHPNICTLYEIGETEDGRLFLAMAYIEGETLSRRIARGPLPLAQVVDIGCQIAAGLAAAHEKGIVHRDVKPGNLLVTPAGQVKIVDFGLARREDQTLLTHAGTALGTAAYMSPELLRGDPVDLRTDLWALGVVLYEMISGEPPFGESEAEAVAAILRHTPRPLSELRPEIPEGLQAIVARALAKPRGQRYASAAQMRDDLTRLLLGLGVAGPPPAPAESVELEETLVEASGSAPATHSRKPATDELPTGLRLGSLVAHFRVLSPLGSGSMGVVYRAEDTLLARTVALKFLSPERTRDPAARERFLREARAASALDHPNLCTVHEVGETAEERLYLAMPCYDGETLAARIARGPLPTPEAVDLAAQAARGLAKAHRGGIVHRDVKPANLLVTGDSVVKILDFGLARLASETDGGSLAGTPAYMSPEQTRKEPVGPATDVWSLGVVLYEMLAGRRPFGGGEGGAAAVFHAIRETAPEPLAGHRSGLPAELAELVSRMLAKDPAARPAAAEAQADLERLRLGLTTGMRPGDRPPPRAALGLPGALLLGVLLGLLGLLGIGGWLWPGGRGARPEPLRATFARLTDQEGREAEPSLSPDGTLFAYAKAVDGSSHLFLQKVGEKDPVDLSAGAAWKDREPAFSPDGRRLAFRSEREGGGIFLLDLDGLRAGPARRLARFGYNPAWSPDGREIACATEEIMNPAVRQKSSRIWIVAVATGEARLLTPGDAVQPSWSPHGRRIAYWNLPPPGGNRVLWTVPATGGAPVKVLGDLHLNWSPVWSPDGRYLYFASDRAGSMNLWRVPIDEGSGAVRGEPEPVTTSSQWSGPLALSGDGRHLLYATDDGRSNLERAAFDPAAGAVAGPLRPVTQGSRKVRSADLSPDGRSLVFDTAGSREDLYVVDALGGKVRSLTDDDWKDRAPRWSPDGRRIAFYSNRGGRYGIWTIRPDGGGLAPIPIPGAAPLYLPIWSRDGRSLFCLRGAETVQVDLASPAAEPARLPLAVSNWSPSDLSADGRWLAGFDDTGLDLYSFDSRRTEQPVRTGEKAVFWGDSRRLLYIEGGRVKAVDRATRAVREILAPAAGSAFTRVIPARDGRGLYLVRAVEEGDIWMLTLH